MIGKSNLFFEIHFIDTGNLYDVRKRLPVGLGRINTQT